MALTISVGDLVTVQSSEVIENAPWTSRVTRAIPAGQQASVWVVIAGSETEYVLHEDDLVEEGDGNPGVHWVFRK